jgi:DMSO reductase family type II enzyme heme b subunit
MARGRWHCVGNYRLAKSRRARCAAGLFGLGLVLIAGCAGSGSGTEQSPQSRAHALFARHCAACHGPTGRADSALAPLLWPRPRSFALGSFNLVSSRNGAPTDADLVRALERGLPGSTMPSFAWLPEDDLRLLAGHVRALASDGHVAHQELSARVAGRSFDATRARQIAERALTPDEELPVPEPLVADGITLTRGRELFVARCAACHGADGKGYDDERAWAQRTEFAWARDLTHGVLKGGASHRDLHWRIAAGMPAVGMPPTRLDDASAAALVAYVRSLLPADADHRAVQRRERLTAARVATLPQSADDPAWQGTELVLAPLQWHEQAVHAVEIAALHDGSELAVRLRWRDATRDDRALDACPDAAALQLSDDQDPPVIAMGARGAPVHIWHWQTFRPRDAAGLLDALVPLPDGTRADVPLQSGEAPVRRTAVAAHGLGAGELRPFRDAARDLAVQPSWNDGAWTLLLRRKLTGSSHDDLSLVPGTKLHVAVAVWNGAAADLGMRKSISVWQRLELAP